MNRWAILFSFAFGLGVASCGAAESEFCCTREVVVPALAAEELVAVPLEADVYGATQDRLPDLRLLDDRGHAVPFLLRQPRATQPEIIPIEFWRETEQQRSADLKQVEYPVAAYRVEQEPDNQQTLLYVDTRREPLTSLAVETSDRNFSRRVAVQVLARPGGRTSWRDIGSSTLTRIDFKGLQQAHLTVRFPQTRQVSYRLVIDNRDSPPLQVTGVQAAGTVHELLFLAQPRRRYQICYGSPVAEAPQYDTTAIRQVLDAGFQPTLAQLGVVDSAPDPAQVFQWSSLLNNRGLLLGTITLLVLVLAWGLYRAVQRVDDLPSP